MKKNKKGVSAEQQRAVSTAHASLDKESASDQSVYAVADENYAQLSTRFGGGSQDDDKNYAGLKNIHPQESRPPMPLPKPVVFSATATSPEVVKQSTSGTTPKKPPRLNPPIAPMSAKDSGYANVKAMSATLPLQSRTAGTATKRRPIPAPRPKRLQKSVASSLESGEPGASDRDGARSTESEGSLSDQDAEVFHHEVEPERGVNERQLSDQGGGLLYHVLEREGGPSEEQRSDQDDEVYAVAVERHPSLDAGLLTGSEGSLSDQSGEVFYHELERQDPSGQSSDQDDREYEVVSRHKGDGCAQSPASSRSSVSDQEEGALGAESKNPQLASKAATLSLLTKTGKAGNKKNAGATLPLLSKMKMPHFFAKKRTVSDPAQSVTAKPRAASGGDVEESTIKRNKNQGKLRRRKMTP